MKRIVLALLVLCASVAHAGETSNEITAENVVARMNAERAARGLAPLRVNATLSHAAEDRMRDMEDGGWWSHESPEGRSPFVWMSQRAYAYQYAGENLASGFETVGLLVESWMESRGHRENILSANYDECGVAIIEGSTIRPAAGKSVVVLFGRQRAEPKRADAR